MDRILFASDLDNTILFSYKHKGDTDRCVEILDGREQGFCTVRSLEMLAQVNAGALFVPVTTRSVDQYRRIAWPSACRPRYAAASNGGVLLDNGVEDPEWYSRTLELIAPWRGELSDLQNRLPEAPMLRRSRIVDGLYLFAVCDDEQSAQAGGGFFAGRTSLEIAVSGRKVYFFPPPLNKGTAVSRLRDRFRPETVICAGDSSIDVPMLRIADIALLPDRDMLRGDEAPGLRVHTGPERFPDFVVKSVVKILR